MSGACAEVHERLAAMLLLTLATGAAIWVEQSVVVTSNSTAHRQVQLRELQLVTGAAPAALRADLRRFDGLFHGHELVWENGVAGSYLTLLPVIEGAR